MKKHGGYENLCGSDRRSIIPYVHGRMGVILQCYVEALVSLSSIEIQRTPLVLTSVWTFYSSRPDSYNETQGLTGGLGAGKTLCSRALMARSSR
jgi:hypothetical protein